MVYVDVNDLSWQALLERWSKTRLAEEECPDQTKDYILDLFLRYIPPAMEWYKTQPSVMINAGHFNLVQSCLDIFSALIRAN